jgi:uncharacterized membrane protein YvbJ
MIQRRGLRMAEEFCENCGQMIGKLQTAYVFKGHVVCCGCEQKLKSEGTDKIPPENKPTETVKELKEINKSTSFLATVVWIIIILIFLAFIINLINVGARTSQYHDELNSILDHSSENNSGR